MVRPERFELPTLWFEASYFCSESITYVYIHTFLTTAKMRVRSQSFDSLALNLALAGLTFCPLFSIATVLYSHNCRRAKRFNKAIGGAPTWECSPRFFLMIGYASNTGTRRNLDALREAGWRILLTPANPTPRVGLRHAVDNGAWTAFQQGSSFDAAAFSSLVERHGAAADFVIIPDIVAGGMDSLDFSLSWIPRLKHLKSILLPVQDGMDVFSVTAILHQFPNIGIFLGGTTEWKLATMASWGGVAAATRRHYHVGRVNTARRIRLCEEAGAHSFDGTSATRFSCTLPLLESARRNRSLFRPLPHPALTPHIEVPWSLSPQPSAHIDEARCSDIR